LLNVKELPRLAHQGGRSFTYMDLDTCNTVNVIQTFFERSRSEHSS
jgi:hypothetical protein